MKNSHFLHIVQTTKQNTKNMDVKFFKELDLQLKTEVEEAQQLTEDACKGIVLNRISKYACQILAQRMIAYRKSLLQGDENKRFHYFNTIKSILLCIYKDFDSYPKEKQEILYTCTLPTPKSTKDKNKALEKIYTLSKTLETDWLECYLW